MPLNVFTLGLTIPDHIDRMIPISGQMGQLITLALIIVHILQVRKASQKLKAHFSECSLKYNFSSNKANLSVTVSLGLKISCFQKNRFCKEYLFRNNYLKTNLNTLMLIF